MTIKNFEAYTLTYLRRAKDYDGVVLFHALNGDFLNGWIYEEGVLSRELLSEDCGCISRSYESEIFCAPVYEEIWANYYYGSEQGGNYEYNGTRLIASYYVGDDCFRVTYWVDDDIGGGGSGGGGGFTPGGGGGGAVKDPDNPYPEENEKQTKPDTVYCSEEADYAKARSNDVYGTLKANDLKGIFEDLYLQDDIEHGVVMMYDMKNENFFWGPILDGTENSCKISYRVNDTLVPIASVHNHPKSKYPSIQDVYMLSAISFDTKGKMLHSFVLCKDGTVFDLQIVDTMKANAYYKKVRQWNGDAQKFELSGTVKKEFGAEMQNNFNKIHAISEDSENWEEWEDFAFAHFIQMNNTGMIFLRKSGEKFEVLATEERKINEKEIVIYRQICK